MDKQLQIGRFSRGMQQASGARDWLALTRLDGELATALQQWPALSAWSAPERAALQQLQQVHAQVRLQCAAELQNLSQTLEQMREGRGRWQAYAESANWQEEEESQA